MLVCETEREKERELVVATASRAAVGCCLLLGGQMMPQVGLKWQLKSNMYKLQFV